MNIGNDGAAHLNQREETRDLKAEVVRDRKSDVRDFISGFKFQLFSFFGSGMAGACGVTR
jgi:hypothetical protein